MRAFNFTHEFGQTLPFDAEEKVNPIPVIYDYKAYCTGEECCITRKKSCGKMRKRDKGPQLKNVDKKADWCPDCGSALYWDKKDNNIAA